MNPQRTRILLAILLSIVWLTAGASSAILTKGINVKIMPVGDSITLGKDTKTGGYRSVLFDWLNATGYTIIYVGNGDNGDPANATSTSSEMTTPRSHEGYGSFRIDMILNGGTAERRTGPPIKTTIEKYKPDVVLLMIGTNDVIQNWELDKINDRLEKLIETLFEADNQMTLVVASIPPIKRPAWADKENNVIAYNAAIPGIIAKQKALNRKISFVDVHAALEKGGVLDAGGVHPNKTGYQKIAAVWYQGLTGETAPPPPPVEKQTSRPLITPTPATVRP